MLLCAACRHGAWGGAGEGEKAQEEAQEQVQEEEGRRLAVFYGKAHRIDAQSITTRLPE
jgi:hypothetical protein